MATPDEIRNYQKNQTQREMREHVLSIKNAVDFSRMQIPPVEWLVPSLVTPGLTTIAGQSKAGKSWLLLQLGLAVSAGGLFIGNLRCRKADVLYLALEDGDWRIKNRLYYIGMNPTRNLYIDTANKITPQNINVVLDEMPMIKMVIIDTLGRYLENEGIDGNDYNEMTKMAGELHAIAKNRNIAVVACTHTRKDAAAGDWLDGVMGSKALVAVSDTILKLSRKREETEGKLQVTGRDVEERTIEMEHTDNWLWYDKNINTEIQPLAEFENF
jgi:RecA-family ATPase